MKEKALQELCDYIVKQGMEKGATAIEALAQYESELEADVELAQVSSVNQRSENQIAIRLYLGKKMGSAFTNIPTKESADDALTLALKAAKVTTEDSEWVDFSHPKEYPKIEGLWDDSVTKSDSSQIVKNSAELIANGIQSLPGLIPAYGGSGSVTFYSAYANSNGVSVSNKGTGAWLSLGAVAKIEGGTTPMVFSFDVKRGMDLDMDYIVGDVSRTLKICMESVKGKTGKHTVVMHPSAYSQLFQYTLIQSVRGDNVVRGKSMIGDKLGEQIAAENVSIFDDGTDIRGLNTSLADDEGVPRQKTPLIEKGVLRSFLWDTYWANKEGVQSTGNASRNTRQGLVEISRSNMVIEPGTRDIGDIIADTKYGYYIRGVQGAHSSNPESGDFSIVGNPAILIEDGELKGAVHGLMLSGNVFDLLKNVQEMAKTQLLMQTTIGPEIVFNDVDIIAKE